MSISRPALVIDANNVLMRAVRAMERTGLSSHGVATGPLLAFINTISKHVREEQPSHVVACWDGGRSDYRVQIHAGYKAHRLTSTDDFKESAFALAKEFCTLAGIHHVERPGFEADDLISWHWHHHRPLDQRLVILSSDKDFLQLLVPNQVEQVRLSSADTPTDRWTYERFQDERGYSSRYEDMVMALTGDAGDGVPGVPRIGPKTAPKILREWNWSLENAIRGEERLKPHADQIRMAFKLVSLRTLTPGLQLSPMPLFDPVSPVSALYGDLLDFLARYQMNSVRERLLIGSLWRP